MRCDGIQGSEARAVAVAMDSRPEMTMGPMGRGGLRTVQRWRRVGRIQGGRGSEVVVVGGLLGVGGRRDLVGEGARRDLDGEGARRDLEARGDAPGVVVASRSLALGVRVRLGVEVVEGRMLSRWL